MQIHAPADEDLTPSVDALRASIDGLCVPGVLAPVVQPIVRLSDMTVVGYEALTRVPLRPPSAPDWWLERAEELDMRPRLEVACWRTILDLGPPPDNGLLFLNVSPATLAEPDLLALRDLLPERVVIEVTEQEAVADYVRLRHDLDPWLSKNVRLAIDDAGAGHSSLRHVIELVPDFIKIDRSLIQGIDADRNRRALVHSLVAFAHEVGITVIAEGIETYNELEVVRDAEVNLGQGYLLARPNRACQPEPLTDLLSEGAGSGKKGGRLHSRKEQEELRLREKLNKAGDAKAACEAVAEFLHRHDQLMPSVYPELEGQLRCIAQRGLWQILDGMSGSAGITGKTWATKTPMILSDVRTSIDYLEAIPGVMSEICIPIVNDKETIGALNVESLTPMAPDTLDLLNLCATLLVERLRVVGWRGQDLPWRRAGRGSVEISRLAFESHTPETAIEIFREVSGMDSMCPIPSSSTNAPQSITATGPLGSILASLPENEIADLANLVDNVSSCYTANDSTGRGFIGTESIRAFARAIIVLPLRSGGTRIGTIVLAHSRPRALSSDDVEPLELIAGHLAATLDAAAHVDRRRQEATRDSLTGLGNRAAFERELDKEAERSFSTRNAVFIVDIDHFKKINDDFGHLTGNCALQSLAHHMCANSPGLQVFRYGGDEFACLIPNRDAANVVNLAEIVCKDAETALSPYGTSVTAGVAIPETAETPWETFARADEALLLAKRHSRGEVVLSHPR